MLPALFALSGASFVFPAWFGFVSKILGFGAVRPTLGKYSSCLPQRKKMTDARVGTLATWHQSTFGTVWGFSTLQSVAMGGYGVSVVNGIVQGASAVGMGMAALFNCIAAV